MILDGIHELDYLLDLLGPARAVTCVAGRYGAIEVETPERGTIRVGITRLHLEEDAGKSLHDRIPGHTAIDLNRAGTPLAEIVGFHDLRSPAEARAYVTRIEEALGVPVSVLGVGADRNETIVLRDIWA